MVDRAEEDPFDKRRLRRRIMIRRLVVMLKSLRDFAFDRTNIGTPAARWPPEIPDDELGPGAFWQNWGFQSGSWVRRNQAEVNSSHNGETSNVKFSRVDSGFQPEKLEPGSAEYSRCLVALARALFAEYDLKLREKEPASTVIRIACELFECVSSGLCLEYDLDARVLVDGEPQPLDVLERTVMCIVRRLQKDNDHRKLKLVICWWRALPKLPKKEIQGKGRQLESAAGKSGAANATENPSHLLGKSAVETHDGMNGTAGAVTTSLETKQDDSDPEDSQVRLTGKWRVLYDLEKVAQFAEVQLLIEWGQTRMVRAMLDELGGRRAWCWRTAVTRRDTDEMTATTLQRSFLNRALHLALKHDNCDIASLLLARGADASQYVKNEGYRDLLVSAFGQGNDPFLYSLIKDNWVPSVTAPAPSTYGLERNGNPTEAAQSAITDVNLKPQLALADIVDDQHARDILRRIYSTLVNADDGNNEKSGAESAQDLRFGENEHLEIFLLLLLLGRPQLAQRFWERDGRDNPPAFLRDALLACIVCRRLVKKPDARGQLRDSLQLARGSFEHIAASILQVRK